MRELLDLFAIAPLDREVLEKALGMRAGDFGDAVVHEAARAWGAAGIVTRNVRGFAGASLPVFHPDQLLSVLLATGD